MLCLVMLHTKFELNQIVIEREKFEAIKKHLQGTWFVQKKEDGHNGRRPKWKTPKIIKMEDNLLIQQNTLI